MTWKNTENRYGSLSISLHWLMLVLIAAVYACIELKGNFPKGSETRDLLKEWHFMLGLSVFALVWLRILARIIAPTPKIQPAIPQWQAIPAKLMHLALYALMLGAPFAGWLILSAAGKPIPFFGMELPPLVGKNPDLAKEIKYWHELAGTTGYWLIGLHALAGLFHHYVSRDNTLTRMLPERKSS
ncbi:MULTISPECIES: cytochrome b [Pseudomonas]|jgi:cytochrome b561|uniref:Cytochrome b561 homolog 1 n=1 Tax=Pseudomonas marincola TaxID=437900 RepID=A0A1I6Y353_9PSED|nr:MULTISPECIES: cytochrome b [Pseudomonas]MAB99870.1 cytochrome b [Pseudomonadaceae bacterium]MBQ55202.1 cytochrome b [Pseudomonadaceae bacterium]NRH29366.1 cytochrome b [Pseudomonas sp. MS19]OEO26527.1 cytochrome B [Pseudomonas sp. J237]CAE6930616.1 Cytochrome b561 homolog 1 [Pseudomonas marincola]